MQNVIVDFRFILVIFELHKAYTRQEI